MVHEGEIPVHGHMEITTKALIEVIEPYFSDLVLVVECVSGWYRIEEPCSRIIVAELDIHYICFVENVPCGILFLMLCSILSADSSSPTQ